jgi:ribosome-associated toxin RatA of RatAB toxin-antitoxin module
MKSLLKNCLPAFCLLYPCLDAFGSDEAMERMRAGEILLRDSRTDESGGSAQVSLIMRAPAEEIWKVFMSCDYAFIFVAGLKKCEVIEESVEYVQTRQVVDKGWLMPTMDYVFETRRTPFSHMEFKLIEGNLKTLQGFWDLQPVPEGVLVTHEMRVRPKVPAPRWMIRRTIKKDMLELMACIRGLTERQSPVFANEDSVREDLKLCAREAP